MITAMTVSRIHLRMFGYVVTILLHTCNGLYMRTFHTEEVLKDSEMKTFVGVQFRFITTWTFILQIIYAYLGLICDWLTLKNSENKKYALPRILSVTRDTLYNAVIWPSSFQVATLFWPFYLYDYLLVYPVFIEKLVTRLSNHIMHSFIIPITLWEMVMRPQKRPETEKRLISILVVYNLLYWVVLFYTYFEQDFWIYPIFKHVYGTMYLPLLICYSNLLLVFNYKSQWVIIQCFYPTKKVNQKLK